MTTFSLKARLELIKQVEEILKKEQTRLCSLRYEPMQFQPLPEYLIPTEEIIGKFLQQVDLRGSSYLGYHDVLNEHGKKILRDAYQENTQREREWNEKMHERQNSLFHQACDIAGEIMLGKSNKHYCEVLVTRFAEVCKDK